MNYRYTIVVPNPNDQADDAAYLEVYGAPKLAEKGDKLQIRGELFTVSDTVYDTTNNIFYVRIK